MPHTLATDRYAVKQLIVSQMLNFVFNRDMDMNSIRRQNLRAEINRQTGGNVAQFARQFGIDEARLSQVLSEKYRDGKNFGEKAARTIEQAIGLPALSLDQIEHPPESSHGKLPAISERKEAFDVNVAAAALGKRAIPVISAIQAGALREITEPYEVGDGFATIFTDEDYSRWAFALVIEGDSMLPEFKDGDLVIIEPEWEPRPGEYVAAKNGKEEATFKKYRPRGLDKEGREVFELAPLNDDYPTLRSDTEPLRIIGVMAEHRRKARRR
jgi:SOS-response transcriptional repressor LexA